MRILLYFMYDWRLSAVVSLTLSRSEKNKYHTLLLDRCCRALFSIQLIARRRSTSRLCHRHIANTAKVQSLCNKQLKFSYQENERSDKLFHIAQSIADCVNKHGKRYSAMLQIHVREVMSSIPGTRYLCNVWQVVHTLFSSSEHKTLWYFKMCLLHFCYAPCRSCGEAALRIAT